MKPFTRFNDSIQLQNWGFYNMKYDKEDKLLQTIGGLLDGLIPDELYDPAIEGWNFNWTNIFWFEYG